jgi:3-hydroxyacyl-CoA dehydrogenase
MAYTLRDDLDQRPVIVDGAGTLGRLIAAVYAAGGSDVRIFDMSAEQREQAKDSSNRSPRCKRRSISTPTTSGASTSPTT